MEILEIIIDILWFFNPWDKDGGWSTVKVAIGLAIILVLIVLLFVFLSA